MSFNQVTKFQQGYLSSTGSTPGGVIAGLWKLLLAGNSTHVSGVCTDRNGNIYVTDAEQHIVIKVTSGGIISTMAGLSGTSGNNSDTTVTAAAARFNYPTGICCDSNGDLYVCDTKNHQIRKISNNKVSLVAGAATPTAGTDDGVGNAARFNNPYDIDITKSGTLFVADTFNHAIRKIEGGVVSNFAGLRGTSGDAPVWAQMTTQYGISGVDARFSLPYALAIDPNGYIYVSDTDNYVIKRIDPAARVRIFSGDGTRGTNRGTAKTSTFQDLRVSDVDPSGLLYVVDFDEDGASQLIMINGEGTPYTLVNFAGTSAGSYVVGVSATPSAELIVVESDFTVIDYSSSSSSSLDSSSSSSFGYSSSSSSSESSSSSSNINSESSSSSSS